MARHPGDFKPGKDDRRGPGAAFKKGEDERRGPGAGFTKGKSGNPGGRPKLIKEVQELARQQTVVAIETLTEVCTNKQAPAAARVTAAEALLSRGWGKPRQDVGLTDEDGNGLPVSIEVRFVTPDGSD